MRDRRKEAEDPDKLMEEYKQTGSLDLRNQLVMHYSYIAKSVAIEMSNMYHKYAAVEEMVNQGILAIIDSLDRFDPGHGVKFSTYAFTKVKGAIIDYVRKQDWLPRRVRHNAIRLNNVHKCVYEVSGESIFSYESLLVDGAQIGGLLWQSDNRDSDPESRVDAQELRQQLIEGIDALNEQERLVLSMYYYENLTMKEIGGILGVSEQRIGQINRKLIQKLRDKLERYMKG